MSVKTDRRTQPRKRPLSLVYVELPPSNGGMLRDLNEHGFALRAMMPLHLSEKLPFSIALDNGVRIDGDAIVVRLEDKGHVAALEFAGLAAHSRDHIRRWLEKFEEPLAREAWAPKPPAAPASTLEELRQEARTVIAGPPPDAEPVAPPPPSAPPAPPPQLQQPPIPEPPPPAAQPTASPVQESELVPAPPVASHQPDIAAVPLLPQMQLALQPSADTVAPLEAPPQQPTETEELPLPSFLRQPENAPPPPPAPKLPPLLKLSSVRPSPPPEPPAEPLLPVVHSPVAEPSQVPNPVPLSEVLIQPPSVAATHPLPAAKAPALSRVPPPLEPLSTWESETDAGSPGWMESFTLGRAISTMVFLTLLVGSFVYHREVGQALIWLGRQIAGEEPRETSQIMQPAATPPTPAPQGSTTPANSAQAPSPEQATTPVLGENKNLRPPRASENSDARPETSRPAGASPADVSSGTGQEEYQRATQILKSPSRKAEIPEAVRLLWLAVRKNHVGAEITLAELYRQGRGVPKSCDQTRILLSAAARRGSPDAKKRLQEFQRQGCRD